MLLSYNSESKDWGGLLLGNFTKTIEVTDEVKSALGKLKPEYISIANNMKNVGEITGSTNKEYLKFLRGLKDGSITLQDGQTYLSSYESYLKTTGQTASWATIKTKALSASMKVLSSIGWMVAITAITEGIRALSNVISEKTALNEKYLEQQDEIISKAEEIISSTESRIDSLEELREKLDETNGSQAKMLALSEDINNVLGEGKNKILDNADALAILNAEIEHELKLEKERQKQANQEKRDAAWNKAKNATSTETTNFNEEFTFKDIQGKYVGSGTNGMEIKIGDSLAYYEDIGQLVNKYIEDHLANNNNINMQNVVDYYSKAISAYNSHSINSIKISKDEMSDAMESALTDLYTVFEDVINSGEGFLGSSSKKSIIDVLYFKAGGVIDDEWRDKVYETINFLDVSTEDVHNALGEYKKALNDDIEGNEDIVYENILSIFDNIKQQYPIISSIIDNWLSDMIAELQEISLSNHDNERTVSFDDIFSFEDAEGEVTALGNLNDQIDELQKAYTGLKETMDSYNEVGYFTLDQVQEIMSYGDDYLKYLMDENGNLQLNEEALNNVAVARINEMRAKAISNLMDNLDKITDETTALSYLETQLLETAGSYDNLAESRIKLWLASVKDSDITDVTQEKLLTSFRNQANAINEMFDNISIGSIYGDDDSASKKVETNWKDLLDKETTLLEKQLEASIITFEDYVYKRKAIINKYYDDALISAEDYYSALEDMYDYQISLYDRVIDAVTDRFDKEISGLQKEKDDIEEIYNQKISSIQTEIDALEEARKKREQQVDLEKALYEVERLRSQRDVKLYSGTDRGVIYTNDREEFREAEENLENEKYENHISKLESQIESLEKEMDKATESINDQIDILEDYKDKWNNVADEHENDINKMIAGEILGADWEKSIFENREQNLEIFRNKYIAAQKAMEEATWKVYEAQIAAGSASAGIGSSSGGSTSDDSTSDKTIGDVYRWHFQNKSFATQQEAENARREYMDKQVEQALKAGMPGGREQSIYRNKLLNREDLKVKYYHSGLDNGYVGDKTSLSKDKRLEVLQLAGNGKLLPNEVPAILQKEELVLTKSQQINIADSLLQKAMMPNITLPDYSHLNNLPIKNQNQPTIVNIGDIQMYGVQNVPDFAKALQKHLPNISVQYNGKH